MSTATGESLDEQADPRPEDQDETTTGLSTESLPMRPLNGAIDPHDKPKHARHMRPLNGAIDPHDEPAVARRN